MTLGGLERGEFAKRLFESHQTAWVHCGGGGAFDFVLMIGVRELPERGVGHERYVIRIDPCSIRGPMMRGRRVFRFAVGPLLSSGHNRCAMS